ncbi:hypothetical protein DA2_2754 [Desulfovibrio sp. A2]|nr:hypothetical protein DA2_2754 [Desulfovibrio sp. A2]
MYVSIKKRDSTPHGGKRRQPLGELASLTDDDRNARIPQAACLHKP